MASLLPDDRKGRNYMRRYFITIVGALVALIALAVILIIGTDDEGDAGNVVLVLGFIAIAVPQLLTLLKAEDTNKAIHNGVVVSKVEQGVKNALPHLTADDTVTSETE